MRLSCNSRRFQALEDCTRAMRKVVVAEKQVEVRKSKEIQLTLKPKNIEGSWTLQQGGDQQVTMDFDLFNASDKLQSKFIDRCIQ